MKETELLEKFEEKYQFLYEKMVNGVPLYTCLRDDVLLLLQGGHKAEAAETKKGKIYIKRIVDGLVKLRKLRDAETLIFTSAVYRRDHGRNLAVEYLMERYPKAVVFEWPARNNDFDSAYFGDPQRASYCPLDSYLVKYKLLSALHRKGLKQKEELIRAELRKKFSNAPTPENENEQAAIEMVIDLLPSSCVMTEFSQNIFRMMFRGYRIVKYAIDFWGSGRENIFPVLQEKVENIELQHGIITSFHPGYIYPKFVKDVETDFFRRKLLVYGDETKKTLILDSVFENDRIEVIGNPRILMFKKLFERQAEERRIILFTSQGYGAEYYDIVISYLKMMDNYISENDKWANCRIVIKLHPREPSEAIEKYKTALPHCVVYDNSAQLYDLLNQSILHITVTSTALFEAAAFDVPTILIPYSYYNDISLYGFRVWTFDRLEDVPKKLTDLHESYQDYLSYLQDNCKKYS